jgi:ubiquinone/menaquinone biosynthesis C-methylase UbiE
MAALYDREILPMWSERFGRLLLRGLTFPPQATVLDLGCGTGYPALDVIKRLDGGRVVAIDCSAPLVEIARQKAGDLLHRELFLRTEEIGEKLLFADGVFDVALSNLGLMDAPDPRLTLRELTRVVKPSGLVAVTLPLRGSFGEFYDIFHEVLVRAEKTEVLARLEQFIALAPEPEEATEWMRSAGLRAIEVEVEVFTLLFKSSREFFYAPVIEYGPLPAWKEVAGKGEEMQEIFLLIKEAIDAYFGGRAFELTVKAGCLRGRKPGPDDPTEEQDVPRPNEVTSESFVVEDKE